MKRTYPIAAERFWELVSLLSAQHGAPGAAEELAIYSRGPRNVKIIIRNDECRVSWALAPVASDTSGFFRRTKYFTTDTNWLKQKLELFLESPDQDCDISITPLLICKKIEERFDLSLRQASIIGPILSIDVDDVYKDSQESLDFFRAIQDEYSEYLFDDVFERVDKVNRASERCFFRSGEQYVLNTTILDFCKRNGIVNPLGKPFTYAEVLYSKSNDYTRLEGVYEALCGQPLLSNEAVKAPQRTSPGLSL
ncbi:MAG: hypothetical protein AAF830_10180 [Pseudomonadota bacterium]